MIVFDLQCDAAHRFEAWFEKAGECDTQLAAGEIACPVCGTRALRKMPSAAFIATRGDITSSIPSGRELTPTVTTQPAPSTDDADYEDVGHRFPEEARRIHYRETEARGIRGTATLGEFLELCEEGVPVAPIPGLPKEKLN